MASSCKCCAVGPINGLRIAFVSLVAVSPVLAASDHALASKTMFEYLDCADQREGVPLVECSMLEISDKLDHLAFADVVENFPISKSEEMFRLGSGYIPVAVPRKDYEGKHSWESFGKTYRKGTIKISNQLAGRHSMDAITVSDKAGRVVLTFWYSPEVVCGQSEFHNRVWIQGRCTIARAPSACFRRAPCSYCWVRWDYPNTAPTVMETATRRQFTITEESDTEIVRGDFSYFVDASNVRSWARERRRHVIGFGRFPQ